jgi:MarR family transcriptional regulator, lower aerobic nicotinate degradation pathway regulator
MQQYSCHRLHEIHASGGAAHPSRSSSMARKRPQKAEPAWPLDQRPGFLIRRLHQIHVALFQKQCAAFEITPLQYSLLSALAVRGNADQTTLSVDVALDRTTTTGALKRLQLRNFVERSIHQRDRRAQICRLTKTGANLLRQIESSARAAHRETVSDLSKADQKRFIALMQRIVAARSQPEEATATPD